jgi:hypothetical protein
MIPGQRIVRRQSYGWRILLLFQTVEGVPYPNSQEVRRI